MALRILVLLLFSSGPLFSQVEFTMEKGAIHWVHFPGIAPGDGYNLRTVNSSTSIAGSWRYDTILSFKPAVPLRHASDYILSRGDLAVLNFSTPSPNSIPRVLEILPDRDTVPSNMLKISIVFSEPMTEQGGVESLKLFDITRDREVKNPFLAMATELWSESGDTLTAWIDPGRIKRDLIPNKTLGPVLVSAHSYALVVSSELLGATGVSLDSQYRWEFVTTNPDRISPKPENWIVNTPQMSDDELEVIFDDYVHPSSAMYYISILNDEGNPVDGELITSPKGDRVFFKPVNNWITGNYKIIVDPKLEDLAGNQLHRLFDDDKTKYDSDEVNEPIVLRFHVK